MGLNNTLDKLGLGMMLKSLPRFSAFGYSLTAQKQAEDKPFNSSCWHFAKAFLLPACLHPCFHPHYCFQVKENDHLEI